MAKWTIPDMIPRAQVDAMVAAALTEAADLVDALSDDILDGAQACAETHPAFSEDRQEHAEDARQVAVRIRALITDDAQTALAKLLAEAKEQKQPAISETPTPAQVEDACLSYDHSFGLMGAEQADLLRWRCKEWWRCIARANAIQKEGKA